MSKPKNLIGIVIGIFMLALVLPPLILAYIAVFGGKVTSDQGTAAFLLSMGAILVVPLGCMYIAEEIL